MKILSNCMLLFLMILTLLSCSSNPFKRNFIPDSIIVNYHPDVVKKSEKARIYYTKNPELETIGIIENGFISLGNSYFEHIVFNDGIQALAFAKEIGASLVLIQTKFERTEMVYATPTLDYPISGVPVYDNNQLVLRPTYPEVNYGVHYDISKDKLSTSVTTPYLNTTKIYIEPKNLNQISSLEAQNIWSQPLQNRNYYAIPNASGAYVVPVENKRELNINSYYASFWAKTNYPQALGVQVTDVSSEMKIKWNINSGAMVWAVENNSPAANAPIYRGDVLLSINNEPILNTGLQMGELIRKNVGKKIVLELIQNNKIIYKEIKLNDTSF
jgi:hypothetical protein